MDRNIGATYVDYDKPSEEARMSAAIWIHNQNMTEREVDVAREALRFYTAAGSTPARNEHDGHPRYQGKNAMEVVDGAIKDRARRTIVMHLVVVLAEEEGFYVGTKDKRKAKGVNQHTEG